MANAKVNKRVKSILLILGVCILTSLLFGTHTVFAAVEGVEALKEYIQMLIDIIALIFSAVGVVLLAYSVGQTILAFKNDDPDSKSRATTMVVVSLVLIIMPQILRGLDLVDMITG